MLDRLAAALRGDPGSGQPPSGQPSSGRHRLASRRLGGRRPGESPSGQWPLPGESPSGPVPLMGARARRLILRQAADVLSGPAGLAAFLRTGLLPGPAGTASLPLDVGKATEQIPGHLRRAVIARDRHCAFPGCRQRPAACQVHHLRPRSRGGGTSLTQPAAAVRVPSPHRRAPLGLAAHPAPRRHHHRRQPRRAADPAQPRTTRPRRLTGGLAGRRALAGRRRRGDIEPGHVPARDADHRGRAPQFSSAISDGQRLGFARPQGDVVAGPDRGLELVSAPQLFPPRSPVPRAMPRRTSARRKKATFRAGPEPEPGDQMIGSWAAGQAGGCYTAQPFARPSSSAALTRPARHRDQDHR